MNARHLFSQPKALAATALLAVAGVANAGGVSWSVGVNAPIVYGPGQVSAVVSNGPAGYYYAPQPVYVQPRRIMVVPQPYYGVQPVAYQMPPPAFRPYRGWGGHWHRHDRDDAYDGYREGHGRAHGRGHDDRDDGRRGDWGRRDR